MSTDILIPAIANLTREQVDDIKRLMIGVRSECKKYQEHQNKSFAHAIQAGRYLLELKGMMPHGKFRTCIQYIGIKKSTANNHMRIASANVQLLDNCTGVRDALTVIKADSKKERVIIDAEIVDDDAQPLIVDGTKDEVESISPPVAAQPDKAERSMAIMKNSLKLFSNPEAPAKKENPKAMVREFISSLETLKAWRQRQALCDVIQACQARLDELESLNGKEDTQYD